MTQIFIKTEVPFIEKRVDSVGKKEFILIGIKVHDEEGTNSLRKSIQDLLDDVQVTRWGKQLEALKEDITLSDEEVDSAKAELLSKIDNYAETQRVKFRDFYKSQVIYIKNASLGLQEDDIKKDLSIKDTREVEPIESLWDSPEACLAVLLDMYLGSPSYKDSLQNVIMETVFGTNKKEAKAKNS